MKKSNKGFTLIELLAVIVILAIIALIATPTILGVIETARKGSAESSALGYIDAVEKQIAIDMLESEATKQVVGTEDGTYNVKEKAGEKNLTKLTVKGSAPENGTVTVKEGQVTEAKLEVKMSGSTYCVKYDGKKVSESKKGTCEA